MNYSIAKKEHLPKVLKYSSLLHQEEVKESRVKRAILNELVWVAVPEEQAVGYVLVELFDSSNKFVPNSIFISELFVDEKHRKQGIGSSLVKRVLTTELTDEHNYFSLTHDPKEEWLTGFYERFGFTRTGTTDVGNVILVKK